MSRNRTFIFFFRCASKLAHVICLPLGEFNNAMGLGIGVAIEMVANIEPEVAGFLLDLSEPVVSCRLSLDG